jgi:hypothetical protein
VRVETVNGRSVAARGRQKAYSRRESIEMTRAFVVHLDSSRCTALTLGRDAACKDRRLLSHLRRHEAVEDRVRIEFASSTSPLIRVGKMILGEVGNSVIRSGGPKIEVLEVFSTRISRCSPHRLAEYSAFRITFLKCKLWGNNTALVANAL